MNLLEALTVALHVLVLSMRNSIALCSSYLRRMRQHQRALFELRSRRRRIARHCAPQRFSRRARINWYALARGPVPHRYWVYPRSTDWWDNCVLRVWGDEQWLYHFRMTKQTFMEIVGAVKGKLERQRTTMREPITVEKRVAITLWYLANANSYREVSNQFGVGLPTVGEIVREVCVTMETELYQKTVCLGPEISKIMDGFNRLGMPHCVGAIDETHLAIRSLGRRVDEFGNQKNYSSILLQGAVDHTGRFINMEVGWSGGTDDAFVFASSCLYKAMDSGVFIPGNPTLSLEGVSVPAVMIADGAYPMRRWLMKPFGQPRDSRERNFDSALRRAHSVVERAFGRLKARWRCLSARLNVFEENASSVITACVILHNICEQKGHALLTEKMEAGLGLAQRSKPSPFVEHTRPEVDDNAYDKHNLPEGEAVREVLANFMFRNMQQ